MKNKNCGPNLKIFDSGGDPKKRICIGTPTLGFMRVEWMMSRFGQIIPCNWSNADIFQFYDQFAPTNFVVDDAQNIIVQHAINVGSEWLFLLEDDVLLPQDTFIKINDYIREAKYPVVSGLYYVKSNYPEPMIYRGRGNSYYDKWKFGEKVWVDGVPTGCLLIHMSLLKTIWEDSEVYTINTIMGPVVVHRVFETPRSNYFDPEQSHFEKRFGTSDLNWCERVIKDKWLEKSGWGEFAKKHPKYPFLMDTSIFCQQIDHSGRRYPGESYRLTKQWKDSPMAKKEEKEKQKRNGVPELSKGKSKV